MVRGAVKAHVTSLDVAARAAAQQRRCRATRFASRSVGSAVVDGAERGGDERLHPDVSIKEASEPVRCRLDQLPRLAVAPRPGLAPGGQGQRRPQVLPDATSSGSRASFRFAARQVR